MSKLGHNNNDLIIPIIRIIIEFSRPRNWPCHIMLVLGNVADIDTLRKTEQKISRGTLFVMARGFIDGNNFQKWILMDYICNTIEE